ncbi:COMM domain-containing protein 3 [Holothuria leucospilota]|uniref:COMM domain-containing protein 3 n=1 Tax=Holothuria leucospilota TaxID=206669 RepID=A0A9Q0YLB1_HOLLE|nr:COMM domain-containing protein 3 [Holothuria leucospilota]
MELSTEVLQSLQLAGDAASVPDKCFSPLVTRVLKDCSSASAGPRAIASKPSVTGKPLPGLNAGIFKQVYAALYTMVLEASKHDLDHSNFRHVMLRGRTLLFLAEVKGHLRSPEVDVQKPCNRNISSAVLEECKYTPDRIEVFAKAFEAAKPQLRASLSDVGSQFPHIVDVDWRLDYYIKNNHLDKVNEPTYLVTLKTEEGDGQGTKDIQFACSIEQLQVIKKPSVPGISSLTEDGMTSFLVVLFFRRLYAPLIGSRYH